ncbi:hypothetical protein KBB12_01935 [Candidatus Woesebacteria bacterium]|nr:hypothetical protein [Candidatus Woesebacteria bacterium]
MPEKQMDFDAYEPPIPRAEVVLPKWVEVNATMIDPQTGVKLDRIANKVGAEIRRSGDSQLVVVSKEGLALEKEIGATELARMLDEFTSLMKTIVDMMLPNRLVKAFLYGMPDSRDNLMSHMNGSIQKLKEGMSFSWGRASLLSIGGQSMAIKTAYDHAGKREEFVVKTTSPLALTTEPIQAMILSPLTSELLRREILCEDQRFKREIEALDIQINRGLIATPYLMVERYISGQPPRKNEVQMMGRVRACAKLLNETLGEYVASPPGAETEKFMSAVAGLDAVAGDTTAHWPVAPELRGVKLINFIEGDHGTLHCIDPFVPKPVFDQNDPILDITTKDEGYRAPERDDITTPFALENPLDKSLSQ